MNRTTRRRARIRRRCDMCPTPWRWIEPGDQYLEYVASPDHDDLGNLRWVRLAECAGCATAYGRGHLVNPPAPSTTTHTGE